MCSDKSMTSHMVLFTTFVFLALLKSYETFLNADFLITIICILFHLNSPNMQIVTTSFKYALINRSHTLFNFQQIHTYSLSTKGYSLHANKIWFDLVNTWQCLNMFTQQKEHILCKLFDINYGGKTQTQPRHLISVDWFMINCSNIFCFTNELWNRTQCGWN